MDMYEKTEKYFKEVLSAELKKPIDKISSDSPFDTFGIDSLMIMRLNKNLEKQFGRLPKTLFFEYNTLRELVKYFVNEHPAALQKLLPAEQVLKIPHRPNEADIPDTGSVSETRMAEAVLQSDDFQQKTEALLCQMLLAELKNPSIRIKPDIPFEKLGIDSLMIMRLNKALEKQFGRLPKTLFFEYFNIRELAGYFVNNRKDILRKLIAQENTPARVDFTVGHNPVMKSNSRNVENTANLVQGISSQGSGGSPEIRQDQGESIAIIGINGRYPQADDLEQFWLVLKEGKDCITEIPLERWDYSQSTAKCRSRWGGFLKDVDKFDPLFFNISPREAEMMDPQQRLFLEICWKVIEDAGYSLQLFLQNTGASVGVFVGSSWTEYELLSNNTAPNCPDVHIGSIASRVSYHFGFNGPSIAMDTHCSSSLTAVHLACESIRRGECRAAVAGGVNLSLHPNKYKQMNSFLSTDGRCRSFGEGGNGYVPSEGVGAVVLKPLKDAIRDCDIIYAVIKGGAINHGGRTNGYSVPNPNAQCNVIKSALDGGKIDPSSISYIETHGTGTELGDPVEISGLTKAFEYYTKKRQFCPLGSVKSNIGHAEAAAGIAQITKVVLQMKHKMLVPSLHCEKTNPNIDFAETPFYMQQELAQWQQPYPRRAGISSFGAGGANAHLILEEYEIQEKAVHNTGSPYIVVLSAKTEKRLMDYAGELVRWLKGKAAMSTDLASVAYTLQVGREAMEERLALVVSNAEELTGQLESFLNGNQNRVHRGKVEKYKKTDSLIEGEEGIEFVKLLISRQRLDKLAQLWLSGIEIEWDLLYDKRPRRISLPTYPFERMRCWIPEENQTAALKPLDDHLVLEKAWRHSPLETQEVRTVQGRMVIFANQDTLSLAEAVRGSLAGAEIIILCDGKENYPDGIAENAFPFHLAEAGLQIARQILEKYGAIAGVIDLSDLYSNSPEERTGVMGRLTFLQELIKNETVSNLVIFQLTSMLQTFMSAKPTLAGADLCGFVKMLGQEYKKVVSKTVDMDLPLSAEKEIADLIYREMYAEDPEVCYREDKRYLPYMKELYRGRGGEDEITSKLLLHPDRVIVITGGTRGIGFEIARHLVERGVRKLVVMGITEFPDRQQWDELLRTESKESDIHKRISNILEFESKGVTVDIYSGPLTDKDKLEVFFNEVRKKRGAIGGVIHCAGLLLRSNPVFINKGPQEIKTTREPKVQGLEVLHEIFSADQLDFFILFSSVSSLIPSLATGGSDYAAANEFMNHFAEYQFAQGNTYYKSIMWPSWKEVGMGEIKSPIYIDQGFISHSTKAGLFLFDKAFDFSDKACLLPCIVNPAIFYPAELFSRKERRKKTEIPAAPPLAKTDLPSETGIINWLKDLFSRELKIPQNQLNDDTPFEEYGVDSILIAVLIQKIEEQIGKDLDPSIILEYPTIRSLASYMKEMNIVPTMQNQQKQEQPKSRKIAVIGMACNFPGSPNLESYWRNLVNGVSSIREIPKSRFDADRLYCPEYRPGKIISKYGGFIDGIEDFDPLYFNISETEAPHIDPLMRQVMEISVQAVRNAGYEKNELSGQKAGVYIGARISNFFARIENMLKNTAMGVGQNFIAAHLSHFFNLKGPSMVVDTGCSSSLVSLHLACQSIITGESDLALAGGVDIILDEKPYLLLSEARALSPDGKCHTFDEKANGFIPGEGCGIVILKPLEKAWEDGDRILAVIDASAVNNDGRTMGITTPNPEAQMNVIETALNKANIDPASIGYLEAHGTGTLIGDPIELKALTNVFQKYTQERQFCAVGSVKTNHGHLLSAAGVSSFIKVVLSIMNRQIPPTLNCTKPNPRFQFTTSPFYPNTVLSPWQPRDGVLRAGISGFGFGGTNAHIIVSECEQELAEKRQTVRNPLPPVEFSKKRYWIDTAPKDKAALAPLLEITLN